MVLPYQLYIKDRLGVLKDYAMSARDITFTTERADSAGMFSCIIHKTPPADFHEGNQIGFYVNGEIEFWGWIVEKNKDHLGNIQVTAYDQLWYLKANQSYVLEDVTAGDVIRRIANDLQLTVGEIDDTGYRMPYLIQENKSCFDIISYVVGEALVHTGEVFIFYDDRGELSLKHADNMLRQDVVLGDKSLVYGYDYTTSIEGDTYNKIKLVKPNAETGTGDAYIFQDSYTINLWGTIQYYETVDENLNEAQIIEYGQVLLSYYNRIQRTLTLDCIGVPRL